METTPHRRFRGALLGRRPIAIYISPPPGWDNMAQHKRKDVENRVAKIHGHVHAVREMLEDGRSYSEVVHQIVAIRSALDSVIQVIVDDLVEDCVAKAEKKEPVTDSLVELQQIVARIR